MIPSLTNRCILFLREHLDSSNIFCVLKHSKLIENKSLWRSCWKFIDKEAKDVLESSEFFEMDRSDLIELVKRNTMNIEEIELFTAINKWAANQCKKLGLDTVERRQILGDDIIDNLRFPVMEENEFNVVKSTNLLTKEETQEVLNNFADSRWPIRFLRHKRQYDPSSQRRTLYHRGQILDIFVCYAIFL